MKPSKSVKISVRIWASKRSHGPIKIHIAGNGVRSRTINDQPGLMRFHPALFRDLKEVLVKEWPAE